MQQGPNMQSNMQQMNVKINPDTLDDLVCPKCDYSTFITSQKFKSLPATHPQNPSGKPAQVSMTGLMCLSCRSVYPSPEILKTKPKIIIDV